MLHLVAERPLERIALFASLLPSRTLWVLVLVELGGADNRQPLLGCKLVACIFHLKMSEVILQGLTRQLVMIHDETMRMHTPSLAIVMHGDVAHRIGVELLAKPVAMRKRHLLVRLATCLQFFRRKRDSNLVGFRCPARMILA